jgi:hypothetical protein
MLASRPVPPIVTLVPLMWTVVAGSAAFALGMPADLALLVAGFVVGVDTWRRRPHVIRELSGSVKGYESDRHGKSHGGQREAADTPVR